MKTAHQATETVKHQRIDLRTTSTIKNTLAHAAELKGATISSFMVEAAYEKAKMVIKENEVITLPNSERDRFLSLLERAAKPNAKLKQAMKKYLGRDK